MNTYKTITIQNLHVALKIKIIYHNFYKANLNINDNKNY